MISTIHVVFKTHLDIGFTDLAANVTARYLDSYLPRAIALSEELERRGGDARFIWTTGSWLINEALRAGTAEQRDQLEEAIRAGRIRWHGLPMTTHTEVMDAGLVAHGIGIARRLDERFGLRTIAAKMTDVPGHTIGLVPLLASSGLSYLHIGVNGASPVPEVPEFFRWQAPDGSEVVVNYAHGYGATDLDLAVVPGGSDALHLAHTGDNFGPPPADDVEELFARLRAAHPGAVVRASTLDEFARAVLAVRESLPVVTDEIGDSWIHGIGSDPLLTAGAAADAGAAGRVDRHGRARPRLRRGPGPRRRAADDRRAHVGRRPQDLPPRLHRVRQGRLRGRPRARCHRPVAQPRLDVGVRLGARGAPDAAGTDLLRLRGVVGRAARVPRTRRRRTLARTAERRPRRAGGASSRRRCVGCGILSPGGRRTRAPPARPLRGPLRRRRLDRVARRRRRRPVGGARASPRRVPLPDVRRARRAAVAAAVLPRPRRDGLLGGARPVQAGSRDRRHPARAGVRSSRRLGVRPRRGGRRRRGAGPRAARTGDPAVGCATPTAARVPLSSRGGRRRRHPRHGGPGRLPAARGELAGLPAPPVRRAVDARQARHGGRPARRGPQRQPHAARRVCRDLRRRDVVHAAHAGRPPWSPSERRDCCGSTTSRRVPARACT